MSLSNRLADQKQGPCAVENRLVFAPFLQETKHTPLIVWLNTCTYPSLAMHRSLLQLPGSQYRSQFKRGSVQKWPRLPESTFIPRLVNQTGMKATKFACLGVGQRRIDSSPPSALPCCPLNMAFEALTMKWPLRKTTATCVAASRKLCLLWCHRQHKLATQYK